MKMRLIIIVLGTSFFYLPCLGQPLLQCRIVDSSGVGIASLTVKFIHGSPTFDSVLCNTDADGKISVRLHPGPWTIALVNDNRLLIPGSFLMLNDSLNLGDILLVRGGGIMQEVTIRSTALVRQRNDTTDFLVGNLSTRISDRLEDLLKVLPGLEVDAQGNVLYHGQPVSEILVEGEPFFSANLSVATKNIPAKAVSKIRAYRKSATIPSLKQLTDVSGRLILDVILKPEAKHGSILNGNYSLSSDLRGESQDIMMHYQGVKRLAVFSQFSSLQKLQLSDQQRKIIGLGDDVENDEITGLLVKRLPQDRYAALDSKGFPRSTNNGLYVSNKTPQGYRYELSANFETLFNTGTLSSSAQQLIDSTGFETQEAASYQTNARQLAATLKLATPTDKKLTVEYASGLMVTTLQPVSQFTRRIQTLEGIRLTNLEGGNLTNEKEININNQVHASYHSANHRNQVTLFSQVSNQRLEYEATSAFNIQNDSSQSKWFANSQLYQRGFSFANAITWQSQLSEKTFLIGQLVSIQGQTVARDQRLDSSSSHLLIENPMFQNHLKFKSDRTTVGLGFKRMGVKLKFIQTLDLTRIGFQTSDPDRSKGAHYASWQPAPSTSLSYQFKADTKLTISMTNTFRIPTAQELQYAYWSIDTLALRKGNPSTTVERSLNMNLFFSNYSGKKGSYLWVLLNGLRNSNPILSLIEFNPITGGNMISPMNGADVFSHSGSVGYSIPKMLGMFWQFQGAVSFGRKLSYFKNLQNPAELITSLDRYRLQTLMIQTRANIGKGTIDLSLKGLMGDDRLNQWTDLKLTTSGYQAFGKLAFNLGKGWSATSTCAHETRYISGGPFQSFHRTIIDWDLSKSVLGAKFLVTIGLKDMLNQNAGYSVMIGANTQSEEFSSALGRYGFVRFSHSISRN